ncbi:aldose epimerase family protein [Kovacikia minuta]|uniref:aldose epimerase family protein n=1 Tax=Kovacikia minuta TaxID=2931930 RepID=UPI0036F33E8E
MTMFEIATQHDRYTTYILSDQETNSILEIVPERGGIVTRWQVHGKDILYLDAERFADPALSVRGGIPILFPICGNLPDNTYTYNGQTYTLKQHGFARDLAWEVTEQVTQDRVSLTLVLNSNGTNPGGLSLRFSAGFYLHAAQRHPGNPSALHQSLRCAYAFLRGVSPLFSSDRQNPA